MIKIYRNGIVKTVIERDFENRFKKYGYKIMENETEIQKENKTENENKEKIDINKSRKELFELAKKAGLKVNYNMSKERIIQLLAEVE